MRCVSRSNINDAAEYAGGLVIDSLRRRARVVAPAPRPGVVVRHGERAGVDLGSRSPPTGTSRGRALGVSRFRLLRNRTPEADAGSVRQRRSAARCAIFQRTTAREGDLGLLLD